MDRIKKATQPEGDAPPKFIVSHLHGDEAGLTISPIRRLTIRRMIGIGKTRQKT